MIKRTKGRPPEGCLHVKKKRAQWGRSSREFRRALRYCGKVGFDRSRARKAEGPMTDCRVAAEHRFRRPPPTSSCAARVRSPSTLPECVLEAHARFVPATSA